MDQNYELIKDAPCLTLTSKLWRIFWRTIAILWKGSTICYFMAPLHCLTTIEWIPFEHGHLFLNSCDRHMKAHSCIGFDCICLTMTHVLQEILAVLAVRKISGVFEVHFQCLSVTLYGMSVIINLNIMVADALAPCVARTSAPMILTV